MPSSSVNKQTREAFEDILRSIWEEYDDLYPVLREADRNKFVEEETSLREQLAMMIELESKSLRSFLGPALPQAVKCPKEAEESRQRVRGAVSNAKLTGTDAPLAGTITTPPLNMRRSLSGPEVSDVNINPAVQNDYRSDISEAINSPLETSSDRSRDSPGRRHRGSPGSPPPPRRMFQSGNSRLLSETSFNSGSDTPRRSHSIRRSAPPSPPPQSPRQSRMPRSPINVSSPSPGPLPDPAMVSSISSLAQQLNTLAFSIATEFLSRQAQGRQRLRCSDDYVTRTNCVDIDSSNVVGLTMNNGGTNNSGAVVHETVMPQRLPRHVPQF